MREETEVFVDQTKAKTEKEAEICKRTEEEAVKVEAAMAQYQQELLDQKTKYENDAKLIESMIEEIELTIRNPKALRQYEIPPYPFPEDLIPVITAHSGNSPQTLSRIMSSDELAPLSPSVAPKNNVRPKVAKPVVPPLAGKRSNLS
jgi:hypothetical protein